LRAFPFSPFTTTLNLFLQIGFLLRLSHARPKWKHLPDRCRARRWADAIVWFTYPKGTSKKYKCDFNRDTGWTLWKAAGSIVCARSRSTQIGPDCAPAQRVHQVPLATVSEAQLKQPEPAHCGRTERNGERQMQTTPNTLRPAQAEVHRPRTIRFARSSETRKTRQEADGRKNQLLLCRVQRNRFVLRAAPRRLADLPTPLTLLHVDIPGNASPRCLPATCVKAAAFSGGSGPTITVRAPPPAAPRTQVPG